MLNIRKLFWERIFNTFQLRVQVIVPILMTVGNKIGSIIVLTLYFSLFLFCFCKGYKYFPTYKKICRGILLLIFGWHHFSFSIMAIVPILSDKEFIIGSITGYICQTCGFIVVITIICGGLS